MAAAISMLRGGMDPDAICDAAWCRERLNIPKDETLDEDEPELPPPDQSGLQNWLNKQNPGQVPAGTISNVGNATKGALPDGQ